MAHGRTVVLVNHDNIYEALYDVLNQRYLLKTDPATGRKQRLYRLGRALDKTIVPAESVAK